MNKKTPTHLAHWTKLVCSTISSGGSKATFIGLLVWNSGGQGVADLAAGIFLELSSTL